MLQSFVVSAARLMLAAALPLAASLSAASPDRRLPPEYKWGRCLLVVKGQTRISGKCAYTLMRDGFSIDGPRQVYEGSDYPKPALYAEVRSTDYWATVYREDRGWNGYGNHRIGLTHGEGFFGQMRRTGNCWSNRSVKICLWK